MQTQTFSTTPASHLSGKRGGLVQRYPVASALIITFLLAWGIMIPTALASQGQFPFEIPQFLSLLVGWAPAIAAIVVSGIIGGRSEIKSLLGRFLIWRLNPLWYVLAIFGLAVVMLGGNWLYSLVTGTAPIMPASGVPLTQLAFIFIVTVGLGVLLNTEEVLWRGFMLPRLQARHTALLASLLIAIPEFALHLPYFFDKDGTFFQSVGMPVYFLFTLAEVILLTWIFNSTSGSLIIVTLLHASQNAWSNLLTDSQAAPFYYMVMLLVLAAVALIIRCGPQNLSSRPRITRE